MHAVKKQLLIKHISDVFFGWRKGLGPQTKTSIDYNLYA